MKSLSEFINETTVNEGVWPLPEWFKTMIDEVKPLVYEAFRKNWDEFCKKNEIVNKYPAIKESFADDEIINWIYEHFYTANQGSWEYDWYWFYECMKSIDQSPVTKSSHNDGPYGAFYHYIMDDVLNKKYEDKKERSDAEALVDDWAANYYPLKVSTSKCMIQFKGNPTQKTSKFVYKRLKPIEDME